MTTGTVLITRGLNRLGAFSIIAPPDAASILVGMENLNAMMETWLSRSMDLGVIPLEVPADDLQEPADARNAIIDNLAIQMAPDFDNGQVVVSRNLGVNARLGMFTVQALYRRIPVIPKGVSSTLPVGSGNTRGVQRRTFFGPDGFISNG